MSFTFKHIAQELKVNPEKYLLFGPYWWVVKQGLQREGFNFGQEDDPATRQTMIDFAGGTGAAVKLAMRHYAQHVGSFRNHDFHLPDGTPYFLHDESVTAHSAL